MRHIWSQPAASFAKWKGRGIDTLYWWDQNSSTLDVWRSAADGLGMKYIHQPSASPVQDQYWPGFVGWALPDEPDATSGTPPVPRVPPGIVAAQAASLRKICPTVLLCINFSANNFRNNIALIQSYAAALLPTGQPPLIDRCGVNFYNVAAWAIPVFPIAPAGNVMPTLGGVSDQLAAIFPGVEQQFFVECSNQGLPWIPAAQQREPTPDEFTAEVAMLRARPIVKSIGLFPQGHPNGGGVFSYDNISDSLLPRVVSELKRP